MPRSPARKRPHPGPNRSCTGPRFGRSRHPARAEWGQVAPGGPGRELLPAFGQRCYGGAGSKAKAKRLQTAHCGADAIYAIEVCWTNKPMSSRRLVQYLTAVILVLLGVIGYGAYLLGGLAPARQPTIKIVTN